MQTSDNIADLAAALAKAQGTIKGAAKDANNPHFKSKYADLASVWEACRKALSDNGLSVIQTPGECAGGTVTLTTMLAHASGQWVRETLTIPLAKVDAQGYGSAVTYARRYALAAIVGVAPDDDDGNAAVAGSGAANDKPRQQPQRQADPGSKQDTREQWAGWVERESARFPAMDDEALEAWREANAGYTTKLRAKHSDLSDDLWTAYNLAADEQAMKRPREASTNVLVAG